MLAFAQGCKVEVAHTLRGFIFEVLVPCPDTRLSSPHDFMACDTCAVYRYTTISDTHNYALEEAEYEARKKRGVVLWVREDSFRSEANA